jgi:hypothetical protein
VRGGDGLGQALQADGPTTRREQYVYDRLDEYLVHRAAEREAEAMGLRLLVDTPLTLVGPRLEDILAAEYDALHTS